MRNTIFSAFIIFLFFIAGATAQSKTKNIFLQIDGITLTCAGILPAECKIWLTHPAKQGKKDTIESQTIFVNKDVIQISFQDWDSLIGPAIFYLNVSISNFYTKELLADKKQINEKGGKLKSTDLNTFNIHRPIEIVFQPAEMNRIVQHNCTSNKDQNRYTLSLKPSQGRCIVKKLIIVWTTNKRDSKLINTPTIWKHNLNTSSNIEENIVEKIIFSKELFLSKKQDSIAIALNGSLSHDNEQIKVNGYYAKNSLLLLNTQNLNIELDANNSTKIIIDFPTFSIKENNHTFQIQNNFDCITFIFDLAVVVNGYTEFHTISCSSDL